MSNMYSYKLKPAALIWGLLLVTFSLFGQGQELKSYTQEITGTSLKFDMVAIPGGEFMMGSPENEAGRLPDEGPQHAVKGDPFWMGKYEVVWDLFEPFVYKLYEQRHSNGQVNPKVDAVTRPTKPYLDMTFGMGKTGFPAVAMTQYSAIQFCKWLYTRTGVFFRLPTEAEWEYACRAGTTTPYSMDGGAADIGEYSWYKANSDAKTHPVGSKKPNPWGLYDMHGNVAEWTIDQYNADFYKEFKNKAAANPVSPNDKLYPLSLRGGSFDADADKIRSASRLASTPDWKMRS